MTEPGPGGQGGRPPNLLIIMVDELAGTLFEDGPAGFLHAPALGALYRAGVNFAAAYTPSPLCVPARAAFMTGQLPSRTGVYDNAAELPASIPTFAHHLRRAGYYTALAGKMHFVGPDQLHGFETRLTTDIYPSDFGWTPDWSRPDERIDWWYHNLGTVVDAGTAETSNQLEFDDEVGFHAVAELRRLARRRDPRPFCLTVSFTHPHDPYVARRRYWDLYDDADVPMPVVEAIDHAQQDPHSQRICRANDHTRFGITPAHVRAARRAYFANISYLDERIAEIVATLAACNLDEDTVILFCSDHGDMLGERGLWFKMSFFEGSARVPLLVHAPARFAHRVVTEPASLLDVMPTLLDLAGAREGMEPEVLDGVSLGEALTGGPLRRDAVPGEYMAEAAAAPVVMLRDGRWKLVLCDLDPPQLFDLEADPHERRNLAAEPSQAGRLRALCERARARWDLAAIDAQVRASQQRRHLVYAALRQGRFEPWDYSPPTHAADRFMRNHMDLNEVEARARGPGRQR
jgi:choline-sulfatase